MTILLLAFVIGIVSGLRAMVAPAVVSWAARTGALDVSASPLAFMGYAWTPWIFSLLAVGEIINDKLPKTPSRKVPPQFIARMLSGGLVGGTLGAAGGMLVGGVIAGILGAVAGTLGGAAVRGKLSALIGKDLPAALIEDCVAIALALVVAMR